MMCSRVAQGRALLRKRTVQFKLLFVFAALCACALIHMSGYLVHPSGYFRPTLTPTSTSPLPFGVGFGFPSRRFVQQHPAFRIDDSKTSGIDVHTSSTQRFLTSEFRFPEVNESRVMALSASAVGRHDLLYFLPPNQTSSQPAFHASPLSAFQLRMTSDERQALLMVFQTFVRMCVRHNVTFFLYGGSLLGAYRHHDVIPWDDDVDVMVNASHKEKLRHAMTSVGGHFSIHFANSTKFFWTKARTLQHRPYRWPYVDIFFFRENQTHLVDEHPSYRHDFVFLKADVFPLAYRPFAGAFLPVPKCAKSVLDQNYSPPVCKSSSFSHKLEAGLHSSLHAALPCVALGGLFPFVTRTRVSWQHTRQLIAVTKEVLTKGNRSMHAYTFVDGQDCSTEASRA